MKGLQFKVRYLLTMAICNFAILLPGLGQCQVVNSWITSNNQSKLLQEQPIINLSKTVSNLSLNIKIDTTISFQTMDGFGYTFTEGSAEVISKLSPKNQNDLLNELFNPVTGLGISVLRISIGASDLSASPYTYDDLPAGAAPDTT
jgi:glucosylceramidase